MYAGCTRARTRTPTPQSSDLSDRVYGISSHAQQRVLLANGTTALSPSCFPRSHWAGMPSRSSNERFPPTGPMLNCWLIDSVSCSSAVSVRDIATGPPWLAERSGVAPGETSKSSRPSMNRLHERRMEPGAPGVGGRSGNGAREGVAHEEAVEEAGVIARRPISMRAPASISPGDWAT